MMVLKILLISAAFFAARLASAHDEGHGPKLSDSGKFGGLVAAIVAKKDAGLGAEAKLKFKAELVRSPDGKIQVYVYDAEMKPVDLATWGKKLAVTAAPLKKGLKSKKFAASFDGKSFVGQIPEGLAKPFNLDFIFTEQGQELLAAFDNQD